MESLLSLLAKPARHLLKLNPFVLPGVPGSAVVTKSLPIVLEEADADMMLITSGRPLPRLPHAPRILIARVTMHALLARVALVVRVHFRNQKAAPRPLFAGQQLHARSLRRRPTHLHCMRSVAALRGKRPVG